MISFFRRISIDLFRTEDQKRLASNIKMIVGSKPLNLYLYELAMKHTSIAEEKENGFKESNERLEYLGDAVLGIVIAEYLFKKYPLKDEGFLTEIRSRIVNREVLNNLSKKIGLSKLVEFNSSSRGTASYKSIYGDALEALIGAIYLDRGYKFCRKFIIRKLVVNHFDLESIIKTDTNFKSKIIEWAQKENKSIRFDINEEGGRSVKKFMAQLFVEDMPVGIGYGFSKKKAEQDAAMKSCDILEIS